MPKIMRFAALAFLLSASSLIGQTAPPSGSSPSSPAARTRQEPCWQQAGIAQSVFEQHQAVERDAHSQISTVCADTSLTPQQKMQRVKEIRHEAQQKTNELITADQQKTVAACRQQRSGNHSGAGMHEGGNPCGGQWSRQGQRPNGSGGNTGSGSSAGSGASPQN